KKADIWSAFLFSTIWQITHWIYGFSIHPHFKMQQFAPIGSGTHFSNFVTGANVVTFFDQHGAVVHIGTEITRAVTQDHQIAGPLNTTSGINHITIGSSKHWLALRSGNINTACWTVFGEGAEQTTIRWPLPGHTIHRAGRNTAGATRFHGRLRTLT